MASFSLRTLLIALVVFSSLLPHHVVAAEAISEAEKLAAAAVTNVISATNAAAVPAVDSEALLRSVVVLQERLRTAQQEIHQVRSDADLAAKRASETLEARLRPLEAQQIEAIQKVNRTTVLVVSAVALLALVVVLVSGWFQLRAANRLGEISRHLAALPALAGPAVLAQLGNGAQAPATAAVQASSDRMLQGLDGLEQRVDELARVADGNGSSRAELSNGAVSSAATIISKGQALLNLDQPEQALACFEEVVAFDSRNVEAWIKKGTALERLQRVDEAVAAYDRAIEADESIATAYLFKAGVFNRQKRYAEALQCYERALSLQTQRRRGGGTTN